MFFHAPKYPSASGWNLHHCVGSTRPGTPSGATGWLLTVWFVSGDDLKLLSTDRPLDGIFDGLVVFCIATWQRLEPEFLLVTLLAMVGRLHIAIHTHAVAHKCGDFG